MIVWHCWWSKTNIPVNASGGHSVPPYLWCPERMLLHRKRHGKRGGISVKIGAYLAICSADYPGHLWSSSSPHRAIYTIQSYVQFCYQRLCPANSDAGHLLPCCRSIRVHRRGFTWDLSWSPLYYVLLSTDHLSPLRSPLISRDFNIHVFCPSSQFTSEFLGLLDSFNLVQSDNGSTHQQGHTLDLMTSFELTVTPREISQTCISDHLPIMLDFLAVTTAPRPTASAHRH